MERTITAAYRDGRLVAGRDAGVAAAIRAAARACDDATSSGQLAYGAAVLVKALDQLGLGPAPPPVPDSAADAYDAVIRQLLADDGQPVR